ncbi:MULTISPECIES: hypothetical protein [Microbacterium]|uniref:hypothetical protein n=1 Tax=Microbacterium TaxID=33882 RepID=UPI0012B800E9|nr:MULTISPECIES: hypothetical protein [Microbacterium]MTE24395.1 hypothetical protein [Microbacterium sp. ZXX196]NHI16640.1 hypothetical protein [Microbacterium excoecariae]
MSIAHADLLPQPHRPRPEAPERGLRAVPRAERRRRPRVAYAAVAVTGAVLIAAAQLGVSILTAQGSYELAGLEQQQRQLTLDRQELADDVAGLASPQYLAANASALGMVIDSSPSYLRLSDAAITGSGAPAGDQSTVNVQSGNAAANALIADTPLVTDRGATLGGGGAENAAAEETPVAPPLEDGLPVPTTH